MTPVTPTITRMLKMADPMTVPTPVSFFALALSRDMSEEKSSGAEDPAAMKVAPATSSERFSRSEMTSSDATK